MTIRYIGAILAALLLVAGATAQTTADLLQQGIHTQESAGDLDRAIAIYRQVVASPNKELASQAQYQLVLCMLQKGDRAAAAREAQTLEQSFPAQKDLIAKARQLTGSRDALMPEPWGERESSQLNIKKDGVFTGDYLFYSVDPDYANGSTPADPSLAFLVWEVNTRNSSRRVSQKIKRESMQPVSVSRDGAPDYWATLTDATGDAAVAPLIGPAIDVQGSVFRLRRLPLAVGYKAAITSHALAIGETAPRKLEINVTGIENVATPSGKYNCYRVAVEPIHQTFWFSVDAARSLVKIQSGNVEAELVKIWGPEDLLASVATVAGQAGWDFKSQGSPGATWSGSAEKKGARYNFRVETRKVYTPAAEIPDALRRTVQEKEKPLSDQGAKILSDTIQTRVIQGRQAISCAVQHAPNSYAPDYILWIRTESAAVEFTVRALGMGGAALARWDADQLFSMIRIP